MMLSVLVNSLDSNDIVLSIQNTSSNIVIHLQPLAGEKVGLEKLLVLPEEEGGYSAKELQESVLSSQAKWRQSENMPLSKYLLGIYSKGVQPLAWCS